MFRALCNKFCKTARRRLFGRLTRWAAAKAGLVILPQGFSMFSDALAKEVGVERAAMHQKIKGWQEHNRRQGKRSHFRQGRWWTYGSPDYWQQKEFIWTSVSTVRRAFTDLEKAGLLLLDKCGGDLWLSAVAGEPVNLKPAPVNLQLGLFNLDSGVSNRRPSIKNPSTSSPATGKRTTKKPRAPRKAAVAVFPIPESRDEVDIERRESPQPGDEGHDVLADLPGQLVTDWTDTRLPLETLVAQHGVDRIKQAWDDAAGFDSQIAGMRTLLAKVPAPVSAPSLSPMESLKAANEDWQRKFAQSRYAHLFDPDTTPAADGDPDATPDIDLAEFEAVP